MHYESFSEEIEENDYKFTATLIKVENATITLFDEKGSARLGTLAVAMPQFGGKTCLSSILLGERNEVITKILAEYLARAFNGIALVSTHLTGIKESEFSPILLKLAQKLIEKAKSK